jgi:tetratricopeptide (TPR) repeat protein
VPHRFGAAIRHVLIVGAAVATAAALWSAGAVDAPPPVEPQVTDATALPGTLPTALRDGLAAFGAGRLDDAAALLRRVGPEDPAYVYALENLLAVEHERGGTAAVEELLRAMLVRAPESPDLHARLARVLEGRGRPAEAELAALRALELEPGRGDVRYDVALYRVEQGDVARGLDAYMRARALDPAQVHLTAAVAALERYSATHPDAAAPHYAMAMFHGIFGRPDLEAEALERYLALEPDGPLAQSARQRLLHRRPTLAE